MSAAKHYTEWSKEDKDALASQRMEEMAKKNEELKRRHAEVEADRKKAEQQNSSVTLAIKAKSPPVDQGPRFLDDPSRTRGSGYEDCQDVPRRNFGTPGSRDSRNFRQGTAPRRPYEKEFNRGPNMSERQKDEHEKWKAEREKIDEERIARHKVKREWDKDKVEQEPEVKPLPSSKFYREPNWVSKQDDRPQRRDFNQRRPYRGNDRPHFRSFRQNYENEDANWQDKRNKSFGKSGVKDSSFDKFGRASLSDDEDNKYTGGQRKLDSQNNYSTSLKKNQEGNRNFRTRGRGSGFSQGSQNDYSKPNSASLSNQNNFFPKKLSSTEPDPVRTSRTYNLSDNFIDREKNDQDTISKDRFRGNDDSHVTSKVRKQSLGTWSSDEDADTKANAVMTVQKGDTSRAKQSSGNWSDDDSTYKTTNQLHSVKHESSLSECKKNSRDTWSDDDMSSNINSVQSKSKCKQSSGSWSDEDDSANAKISARTSSHRNNSCPKKSPGGAWTDDDSNCADIKTNSQAFRKDSSVTARTSYTSGAWSDDDSSGIKQHPKSSSSAGSRDQASSAGTLSDVDNENESSSGKCRNDDNWLDGDKSENSGGKNGRLRKWAEKQLPTNFPAGRGRKWSFEPSRQYKSETRNDAYGSCDERKGENRAITLGNDDNLTVTINGVPNDTKGNRPFSQWGVRNSESYSKNTERTPQMPSCSSDTDKHRVKCDEPDNVRRYNDGHWSQPNSRNFNKNRGNSLKRGGFNNTTFQKSSFDDAPPQKFRDGSQGKIRSGRGGSQHSNSFSRGARRSAGTCRYTESDEIQDRNNEPVKNGKRDDSSKENFAATAHPEDIWEDEERTKNANVSLDWTDASSGNSQCLKSEKKTGDGWETENLDKSSLYTPERQSNDGVCKSEDLTHVQMKEQNQLNANKNSEQKKESSHILDRSCESLDFRRNIHESEQNPLHECMANVECTGNESHDDSSWVTTSGDELEEELGGEYIDDDESLHISTMQHYDYGDDTSSPEPVPNFLCSMKEYLNRAETAKAFKVKDKMDTEKIHDVHTSCSTNKLENIEATESVLLPEESTSSSDYSSKGMLLVLESESNGAENHPHPDVAILNTRNDDQKFLSMDDAHGDESVDDELSAENCSKNSGDFSVHGDQKVMVCEMQKSEQSAVSSEVYNLAAADESGKTLSIQDTNLSHLESACEKSDTLKGQHSNDSIEHSKNSDLRLCINSSSIANNLSGFSSSVGNSHQSSISNNHSKPAESIISETISANIDCSESQDCLLHDGDKETSTMCGASSDCVPYSDNSGHNIVSSEENNFSQEIHSKQKDTSEHEIDNHVISSAHELCVSDETEMKNETACTVQHTDIINNTVDSKMPAPSAEGLDFCESVPAKNSCITANIEGNL